MRILVVTPWYPNRRNPYAGAFVARDVRMLRRGHEIVVAHLVSPEHDDDVRGSVGGLRVERIPMRPAVPADWWRAARRIRSLARDVDAVNSHAATSLWPMVLALGPRRRGWVHTEHSSAVTAAVGTGLRGAARRAIRRLLLSRPAVVVAVSEHLASAVRRLGRRGPVSVVPNAVDAPVPPPMRPARHGDAVRLVSVGGLVPVKRPLIAIAAVARLREAGFDADLTWVGDGPLRADAESAIAALGLGDVVRLVGARQPSEVSGFLADADLFLLPTAGETFGVAIAEAIAHGRPVVVGAEGGQAEFVDPAAGELVAGDDPDAYADAVARVLERTANLSAEQVARTLGERFDDVQRLAAYDRAFEAARAGRG
ncbi:glycosyltransferase family 4 protein [Agromyces sp. ZXT2-6]|uniref:glycosyltransferase family 4 protein n=1 Tax=Agromyces sp. ZXT2-6 TaxID=3461153 RepID=UPI004054EB59